MTTRQLVRWCRLHAFSPSVAVAYDMPGKTNDNTHEDINLHQNSSFTPADTLKIETFAETSLNGTDDNSGQDLNIVAVVNTDASKAKTLTGMSEPKDADKTLECLPPSDGAQFVYDELRKRGMKLQPVELEPGVMAYTAADMLYKAMQDFTADVLRETAAVRALQKSQSPSAEITRRDVHKALTQLPEAAFSCNTFLGKADVGSHGSGR